MKCKNCGKETNNYKCNFIYDTGECSHYKSELSKEEMELLYNNGKGLYYPFKEKLEERNLK